MNEERRTPLQAIKDYCWECCGYDRSEVKLCVCEDCPLYPYRLGHNPYSKKPEISDERREAMRERMRQLREQQGM